MSANYLSFLMGDKVPWTPPVKPQSIGVHGVRTPDTPDFGRVVSTYRRAPQNLHLLFKIHEIWSVDSYRKIVEIVATIRQILRQKCNKFDINFGCGSALNPAIASPDSLAVFKGPTSEGREGRGRKEVGNEGKWRGGKGGRGRGGREGGKHPRFLPGVSQTPYRGFVPVHHWIDPFK